MLTHTDIVASSLTCRTDLWYGTPAMDGKWMHWDHATLPHWTDAMNRRFRPNIKFTPPDAPHSPFYPARGLYSSRDESVLRSQLKSLAAAGVDSIMLSWWGQKDKSLQRDSQGVSTDELVPGVLDAAAEAGVGVTWHLEPYGGRSPASVLDDIKYLHSQYGAHPALFRQPHRGAQLPVIFLYDVSAEHTAGHEEKETRRAWRDVATSIRGTAYDAVLLSLYVDGRDESFVAETGVDGSYTYFAADGFTEGSRAAGWAAIARRMATLGKLFLPSVGPGYNDTLIRPWNAPQTRPRRSGGYYDQQWGAAVAALEEGLSVEADADGKGDPRHDVAPGGGITITSYNEWGEGTQIEEAAAHTSEASGAVYADYEGEGGAGVYMAKTEEGTERVRARCSSRGDRRGGEEEERGMMEPGGRRDSERSEL